jgi:hypothetical protein
MACVSDIFQYGEYLTQYMEEYFLNNFATMDWYLKPIASEYCHLFLSVDLPLQCARKIMIATL